MLIIWKVITLGVLYQTGLVLEDVVGTVLLWNEKRSRLDLTNIGAGHIYIRHYLASQYFK